MKGDGSGARGTVTKVVLSGGPAAGKSTVLPFLKEELEKAGNKVFLVPEAASWWMETGALRPAADSPETAKWSASLFRYQRATEDEVFRYAAIHAAAHKQNCVVILDRGLMDSISYQADGGGAEWDEFLADACPDVATTLTKDEVAASVSSRYSCVLFLPSLAVVSPQVYAEVSASNPHRRESHEQAASTNNSIRKTCLLHPCFFEVTPESLKDSVRLPRKESLENLRSEVRVVLTKGLKAAEAAATATPPTSSGRKRTWAEAAPDADKK